MQTKDFIMLTISLVAFVFSIASFIISYKQKTAENIRGIRKALSEAIGQLTEISLAFTQLNGSEHKGTEHGMQLRRLYNSQRSHWANQAEYLISQSPSVANRVDYNILAVSFDSVGDYERAQMHWKNCLQSSATDSILAMHLRGYARFLFYQGNADLGRKMYEESTQIQLPATDNNRRIKADTYAMWSKVEKEFGYNEEAKRLLEKSIACANSIGHKKMKEDFLASLSRSAYLNEALPIEQLSREAE